MARCISYYKDKMLWSLVLTLSICLTNGLTLEEQVQQLKDNYIELKEDLSAKVAKLEAILEQKNHQQEILAAKVARLEELEIKVQHQETLLMNLSHQQRVVPSSTGSFESGKEGKSIIFRTCRETRVADPSLTSGMYWVDPDGLSIGDDPIYVYCDMTTGSTSVLHDSEETIDVGHCTDPGCYSRSVNYYATARQMTALAELSNECRQSINYDCTSAALEVNGVAYSWWNDKNGAPRYFWSGNTTDAHICQCGIDQNCIESFMPCNCDSSLPMALADNGIIADKNILPVTRLNFGRTTLENSLGLHTLGRFECTGQKIVNGMPKSCTDLWQIGNLLSGFFPVLGEKQIELVYCDFTKPLGEPNFQTWIGFADVKSSPTYFLSYVNSANDNLETLNTPVIFGRENLNVGGAMNLTSGIFTAPRTGKYFFSLNGAAAIKCCDGYEQQYLTIVLYANGTYLGGVKADEWTDIDHYEEPLNIQVTVHLQAGDKVWLEITNRSEGALLDSSTLFTGWLVEEDITQSLKVLA